MSYKDRAQHMQLREQYLERIQTQDLYANAFRTKTQLKDKESNSHAFNDDPSKYMHQVFPPNTYFADIVQFGKYERKGMGYFMFMHANSRYIILCTGSLVFYDEDLYEFSPTGVKGTQMFMKAMEQLIKDHKIETLITDAEPGWKSQTAEVFYANHHIKHVAINVSQEGHHRMGILDRAVRTLRDMVYNAKVPETDPIKLQRIVYVYNTTKHKTLSQYLGCATTPSNVFNNPSLELRLINEIHAANWSTAHLPDYDIADGSEVVIKEVYTSNLDKRRRTAKDGTWIVMSHFGQRYEVKNIENGEVLQVFRSGIAPIKGLP